MSINAVRLAAIVVGAVGCAVQTILGFGPVGEIARDVVTAVPVKVAYFVSEWTGSNERLSHEYMNSTFFVAQAVNPVSRFGFNVGSEHAAWDGSGDAIFHGDDSRKGFYATFRGHPVDIGSLYYWQPQFHVDQVISFLSPLNE